MKNSRRDFLIGSVGLTLAGCTTTAHKKTENENPITPQKERSPTAVNALGYRLSISHDKMKNHYEAVVVGSGYGASVIAARLSKKYNDLCVLERGKEFHPGDYSEIPGQVKKDTIKSNLEPLGLIEIARGKDVDIICGNGLGGTSLINAAIAIRPEMNLFELPLWPEEIRQEAKSGKLESYYKRAEEILKPATLNQGRFNKSRHHRKDAEAQGASWGELKVNIRPDSYGKGVKPNEFGYPQAGCVSCGNCCTGCNYGAKNTLLTNYLFIAQQSGAQIFTQVEVDTIEKSGDVYKLNLRMIPSVGRVTKKTITAKHVFLGAGSKGSTEILMRSQSQKFKFSQALGTKLSANGDVMGLSYNTDNRNDSVGLSQLVDKGSSQEPGLIIASYADFRTKSLNNDVKSQFLLLDGVVPSVLGPAVSLVFASYAMFHQNKLYGHLSEEKRKIKMDRVHEDLKSIGRVSPEGALNHSMLYFACGHDSSGGKFVMHPRTKKFDYVWKDVTSEETFQRIEGVMKNFSEQNGGTYIANPRSNWMGKNIQATHPLGGCPMSDDPQQGVVNHLGQVYDPVGGVHTGLYVVDAAIIPHSLAATPLLTITAFAERIAERIG